MRMVMKFGGTSLAGPERMAAAAQRVAAQTAQGHRVAVVVSAQGDQTDRLLQQALQLTQQPSPRELDMLLSAGEVQSAALMAMALHECGCDAVSLTGDQAGIETDGVYANARILSVRTQCIETLWRQGRVAVVAGFQGTDAEGNITTLGRGGSDTTAVALAAWLRAHECRIYTDVDGVYDKDPRRYPDAVRFDRLGYTAMLRMARAGAQVLHERCVELGLQYRVPIRVLSSFRPGEGTWIVSDEQ